MDAPTRAGFVINNGPFDTLVINPGENSNGGYSVYFAVIRDFNVAVTVAIKLSGAIFSAVWAWAKSHTHTPSSWASSSADVTPAINSVQWINSHK